MINNKEIRLAVVNAIKANTNIAPAKVYDTKITPHLMSKLPAIGVYITSAEADGRNHVTPGFVRDIDITVEVVVGANESSFANTCDDLVYTVKTTLFANTNFLSFFENISQYTESIQYDDAGESPVAYATLTITGQTVEIN